MARAVSFGQRRGLGRKYSIDPELIAEQQRIQEEYAAQPQRAALAENKRQFDKSAQLTEAQRASSERGAMIGTAIQAPMSYYAAKQLGIFGGGATTAGKTGGTAINLSSGSTPSYSLGTPQLSAPMGGVSTGAIAPTGGVSGGTALTGGTATGTTLTGSTPAYSLGTPALSPAMEGTAAASGSAGSAGAASSGAGSAGSAGSAATTIGSAAQGAAVYYGGLKLSQEAGSLIGGAIGVGGEKERKVAGGAIYGAAVGGPVGAVVGGVLSWAETEICIIVTACTDRHSYEVEIAREYRDKFMTHNHLRGYYALAEKIVPRLEASDRARKLVKKHLVDRLVDYGEYKLGKKRAKPKALSYLISKGFLGVCEAVGCILPIYIRQNGEVY